MLKKEMRACNEISLKRCEGFLAGSKAALDEYSRLFESRANAAADQKDE